MREEHLWEWMVAETWEEYLDTENWDRVVEILHMELR